jgi:hypothetical protein
MKMTRNFWDEIGYRAEGGQKLNYEINQISD